MALKQQAALAEQTWTAQLDVLLCDAVHLWASACAAHVSLIQAKMGLTQPLASMLQSRSTGWCSTEAKDYVRPRLHLPLAADDARPAAQPYAMQLPSCSELLMFSHRA